MEAPTCGKILACINAGLELGGKAEEGYFWYGTDSQAIEAERLEMLYQVEQEQKNEHRKIIAENRPDSGGPATGIRE